MTKELGKVKQSLEEITSTAREIKNSLLPCIKRVREATISLPKITFLRRLYEELLIIQRIAMLRGKESKESVLTEMQGGALFPFAMALYMPLRRADFPFNYNDFYRGSAGSLFEYATSHEDSSSLDVLISEQNSTCEERNKSRKRFEIEALNRSGSKISRQSLRDLQYFYTLPAGKFVKDYVALLKLIRDRLSNFAELDFGKLDERTIPVEIPNTDLRIFVNEQPPETIYLAEEKKILKKMVKSEDWSTSLEAIQDLITECRDPRLGHLRRYRVLSTDSYLTPIQLAPAQKRDEIIGIDENLMRLEALIRGYTRGKSTPNIVLIGPGGVGKTTSLRSVMEATEDVPNLRYFLMSSLDDIRMLAELDVNYKPVGIIDDLRGEVNPIVYAGLKRQLEGLMDTLFDRALIIISVNPEIWTQLDDPVKQRLGGVELTYEPKPELYEQLVKGFCNRFGVKFVPEIMENVGKMVPRQVRDYVRALGSEQTGLEGKV